MSLVIVTTNQYLLANKIHHIVLNENYEFHEYRNNKGKMVGSREDTYSIHIIYSPEQTQNQTREEQRECVVTIRNKVNAYKVYRDLIQQIREQMPDVLFLNKALENLLAQEDVSKLEESRALNVYSNLQKAEDQKEDFWDDSNTKTIRRPRKAKRANKKVLRRPNKRNRRAK